MADEQKRRGRPAKTEAPDLERITPKGSETIQPVNVEVKPKSAQPTRTSKPAPYIAKSSGAWLVINGTERKWMDRKMANTLVRSNPKVYAIEN